MKIAKQFHWEAAHRLPWHEGDCKNLHGHSYRMTVELEGEPDERGMLMDFKILKRILMPLIDQWDHATLIAEGDTLLRDVILQTGWKHVLLPSDTTSENLCRFVAGYLIAEAGEELGQHRVSMVRTRIYETETSYAELETRVEPGYEANLVVDAETRTHTYLPES